MLSVVSKRNPTVPTLRDDIFSSFDKYIDEIFSRDFFENAKNHGLTLSSASYPKVDVVSFPDRIEIDADIPGLEKKDVSVEVSGCTLTIKGDKRESRSETESGQVLLHEIKRSSFQRSFSLDDSFDLNNMSAKFENGFLKLSIKRKIPLDNKSVVKKIPLE